MKLTNTIRDAFVRAAMDDVPAPVDHKEAIRSLAMADALAALPPKILAAWKDVGTREYIKTCTAWLADVSVCVPTSVSYSRDHAFSEDAKAKAAVLKAEMKTSNDARKALETKLRAVAYSVTTRKALAAALPEFEKYLPPDDAAAIRTLPVVANVVADFVKAGWPKGKKPTAA